jgi:hypothetical protein
VSRQPFDAFLGVAYDFGDAVGLGPVVKMFTLGHSFVPDRIHSGGLRYHGDAPSLCLLVDKGVVEARAYKQNECFAEAVKFARSEGFLPAPEAAHALRAVAQEAAAAREAGDPRVSCSAFRDTATSTCRRTPPTLPASWRTSSYPNRGSTPRSKSCPESRRCLRESLVLEAASKARGGRKSSPTGPPPVSCRACRSLEMYRWVTAGVNPA